MPPDAGIMACHGIHLALKLKRVQAWLIRVFALWRKNSSRSAELAKGFAMDKKRAKVQ